MNWVQAMWEELDQLDPLEQHVTCGRWIIEMQQHLVPALSARRRTSLVSAVEASGDDYFTVAERIGSRRGAVERLINQGRAVLRKEQFDDRDAA